MERLTGFEPATFDLASRRSDLLSYNRTEPPPGLEPGASFVPGTRSGHWSYEGMFREPDSNRRAPASKADRDAVSPPRSELEPPPGADPG
jgi:hypothetical protein